MMLNKVDILKLKINYKLKVLEFNCDGYYGYVLD